MEFTRVPAVIPNPNRQMPLAAIVEFATDLPSHAVIRLVDDKYTRQIESDSDSGGRYRIPVTGLRFGTVYDIAVTVEAVGGTERLTAGSLTFATPVLPREFPPVKLRSCLPERREPGAMMFNVRYSPSSEHRPGFGLMIAVDKFGEIIWSYQLDEAAGDIRRLANGNVLFMTDGRLREIDLLGNTVGDWHAAERWKDRRPPANSVAVETNMFHHAAIELPSGNLAVCSMEIRDIDDFPASDEDPEAGVAPARVVGDVIVEFSRDGAVVNRYSLLDLLDPHRICYGSLSRYWVSRGYPDTYDWSHTNSLAYDPADDSLVASLRHQDCLVKIDRSSGAVKWILGNHANWQAPWKDSLLAAGTGLEWQYHQHDCSVTGDGTVMCFDNGNHRACPFDEKTAPPENYSRAVEFVVDAVAGTARQVWEWGQRNHDVFSSFQSGACRLPASGNTFITYGGICSVDGVPAENPFTSHCMARWIEVTPGTPGEMVFEMIVEDESAEDPVAWSSFRAEHFPDLGAGVALLENPGRGKGAES